MLNSPDELIETLESEYRMTPMLMLRGHIAYKAALQMGQYLAKHEDLYDNMHPQDAAQAKRGDTDSQALMEEAGMDAKDTWYNDICGLVAYANKLTFDMQNLDDPNQTKRIEPSYKRMGIWFNQIQRRENWAEIVKLVATSQTEQPVETYAQYLEAFKGLTEPLSEVEWTEREYMAYVNKLDSPEFALSKKSWLNIRTNHESMYKKFDTQIVDALMDIGYDEGDFDELSIRNQIACIENMRTKIDRMCEAAAKSVNFKRGFTLEQKTLEASAVVGLIRSFDKQMCEMLNHSRYANHAEFMRNFIPNAPKSEIISRRMIMKNEAALMASKPKLSDEDMAKANSDFLDMENDIPS